MENLANASTFSVIAKNEKKDIFDYLFFILYLPWLFFLIFSTRELSEVKLILSFVVLLIAIFEWIVKGYRFEKKKLSFAVLFVSYMVISLIIGILSGYEFSLSSDISLIENYIFLPIFVFVVGRFINYKKIRKNFLWSLIKYLTLLLVILDLVKVFLFKAGIDTPLLSFINMSNAADTKDYLMYRVGNEASLMFLLPIYIFLLFCGSEKKKRDILIYLFIVILGITYALLSGRKILELIIVIDFVFTIIYRFFFNKITKKQYFKNFSLIIVIPILVIFILYIISYTSALFSFDNIYYKAINTMINGLSSDAEGVVKRTENSKALINLWVKSPIFGNGLNSYANESLASYTTKWSYEVVYNALLAQIGIFGLAFIIIIIFYLMKKLINNYRLSNNALYISLIFGFISFIICGASNPLVYFIWPWVIIYTFSFEENFEKR